MVKWKPSVTTVLTYYGGRSCIRNCGLYWWKHSGKIGIAFVDGFDTMLMNVKGVVQGKMIT